MEMELEDQKYAHILQDMGEMIVKKEKKKREPNKLVIINEEELIRQVEIRPILYDKSLKGYRKSALRDQSWKEIASSLGSTVEECRKRWRSLRDAFSKHYKQFGGHLNPLGGTMIPKKKKWLFYDQMFFIAPYLDCGNTIQESVTLQESSHESLMELDVEERINMSEVDESTLRDEDHDQSQNVQSQEEQEEQSIDINDENQFMTRIFANPTDYHEQTVHETSEDVEDDDDNRKCSKIQEPAQEYATIATTDPDERFLLSCAPILKRLSNKKNALARLRIQQVLYNIEFGEQ